MLSAEQARCETEVARSQLSILKAMLLKMAERAQKEGDNSHQLESIRMNTCGFYEFHLSGQVHRTPEEECQKSILLACYSGNYQCNHYGEMEQKLVDGLIELGYHLSRKPYTTEEVITSISWNM